MIVLVAACGKSAVILPAIFSDHMVIQRDRPVPIWGEARPGSVVTIKWQGEAVSTKADGKGRWHAQLPATSFGGPYTLDVNGTVISDILGGDVFLCSGQSNMELPVGRCLDAVADEIKDYSNLDVRYLGVALAYNFDGPQEALPSCAWQALDSEETALPWSAICYFTARYLQEETGVPVGMVNVSVGGSPIESWLREDVLPGYALEELNHLREPGVLDSIERFNANLYVDWQNAHNALPANTDAKWKKVDVFA